MNSGTATLAGRYRLEEVIGRGGMSTVYRATDTVLGRTVAVKVLLATLADEDPAYIARFSREARAAAALDNPGVVAVYDVGADGDARYIVMEYVSGRSLAQLLRGGKPLPIEEATRIGARVADALGAAHAAGIVHRDIKPANVMLAADGTVKVLDFGVARMLDGTTITQAASVLGTAAYMAPERALGKPGDAGSDVYSLGCLLYAMLTGAPPFAAEHAAAVLHQHLNAEPRPVRELRGGVPPALAELVAETLAKSPKRRPRSACEVRDRLGGAVSPTAPTRPLAAPVDATAPTVPLMGAPAPNHRRPALIAALVTAAVLVIGVVIAIAASSSSHSPPAASTARTTATHAATTSTHTATSTPATTTPPATVNSTPTAPTTPGPVAPAAGPPGQNGGPPPGHDHGKGKGKGGGKDGGD